MRGRRALTAAVVAAALAATALVSGPRVDAETPIQTQAPAPGTDGVPSAASIFVTETVAPVVTGGGRESGPVAARETGVGTFTTIGASYASSGRVGGRVRVHAADGWSRWYPLHGATVSGHGPDPGSAEAAGARAASDPVWVGDADGYELALPADATAVRVHLVRPTGEAATVVAPPPAPGAEAAAPAPPVRRREAWGARPFRGRVQVNRRLVRGVVHHTVNGNDYTQAEVPSMLRAIQSYHQDTRGWNDIAYNFVVDRFGTIWEARARSYELPVVGAASSGTNLQTVAVAFLGDAMDQPVSSTVLRSIGRTLGWKMRKHGLRPTRSNLMGHRDVGSTDCPGDALYAQLPAVERVATRGNPPPGPYFDVPWTHPQATAIDWAGDTGVIAGYPDGDFRPRGEASRAAAYAWLWATAGARTAPPHPYTDVPRSAPFGEALDWAANLGIARPASGRFLPARTISRQGMLDLLWRYAGEPEVPTTHAYTDAGADPALDWVDAMGLVGGDRVNGDGPLRRATAAAWLYRVRPFVDVGPLHAARRAVDWAQFHQIVTGLSGWRFRPDTLATRGQAAAWIWHLLDEPGPGPVDATPTGDPVDRVTAATWLWEAAGSPAGPFPSAYTDIAGQPHETAASWVGRYRLFLAGAADTFRADDPLTRSELVRALYRLAGTPAAWAVTPPLAFRG